jgi:hypothetical protein
MDRKKTNFYHKGLQRINTVNFDILNYLRNSSDGVINIQGKYK